MLPEKLTCGVTCVYYTASASAYAMGPGWSFRRKPEKPLRRRSHDEAGDWPVAHDAVSLVALQRFDRLVTVLHERVNRFLCCLDGAVAGHVASSAARRLSAAVSSPSSPRLSSRTASSTPMLARA